MSDYTERAKRYLILIEGGPPSNYSAWSSELPGCAATGDTLEEVEAEMSAAITFHLEGLAQDGDPLPEPSAWACTSNAPSPSRESDDGRRANAVQGARRRSARRRSGLLVRRGPETERRTLG
jgi:predicted RNase H-like HicB family nuclease